MPPNEVHLGLHLHRRRHRRGDGDQRPAGRRRRSRRRRPPGRRHGQPAGMRRLLVRSRPARALRVAAAALLLAGLLVLPSPPASAHGALVDGSPGPGRRRALRHAMLRLEFTDLDPDKTPLVAVLDAAGDPVAVGDAAFAEPRPSAPGPPPWRRASTRSTTPWSPTTGTARPGATPSRSPPAATPCRPTSCNGVDPAPAEEARTLADLGGSGLPTWVIWLSGPSWSPRARSWCGGSARTDGTRTSTPMTRRALRRDPTRASPPPRAPERVRPGPAPR